MFTWQQLHDHITVNLKDGSLNKDDIVEISMFGDFYQLGSLEFFNGASYFELEPGEYKLLQKSINNL